METADTNEHHATWEAKLNTLNMEHQLSCRLLVEQRSTTTAHQQTLFWAVLCSWVHVIVAAFEHGHFQNETGNMERHELGHASLTQERGSERRTQRRDTRGHG